MKTEPDYNAILESSQTESGFSYQTTRRHAERIEKRPHGAWAAFQSGELLDFGCRLVERRGRMLAEVAFNLTAMALQFACRCVEVEFLQFLDTTGLEQSEVLSQGVTRNACESANLLVLKALALQPEHLHALAYSRVRMVVTQPLKFFQILR